MTETTVPSLPTRNVLDDTRDVDFMGMKAVVLNDASIFMDAIAAAALFLHTEAEAFVAFHQKGCGNWVYEVWGRTGDYDRVLDMVRRMGGKPRDRGNGGTFILGHLISDLR